MKDHRRFKRHKRRFKVLYGEDDLTKQAFTDDISEGGMFIVCHGRLPLGGRQHIQIFLDGNRTFFCEGEVVHEKQVPIELRRMAKGGFGIRFILPGELLREITAPKTRSDGFIVTYAKADDLRRAHDLELRHGGVFVATDRVLPRDTPVILELRLPFAQATFEFAARVIHVASGEVGVKGLGLIFQDATDVLRVLGPHLA